MKSLSMDETNMVAGGVTPEVIQTIETFVLNEVCNLVADCLAKFLVTGAITQEVADSIQAKFCNTQDESTIVNAISHVI